MGTVKDNSLSGIEMRFFNLYSSDFVIFDISNAI